MTAEQTTFTPQRFGKFVLLERVGRGGMAEVFRAKIWGPGRFEKEFALKKILPSLLDDEQFVAMFIDEARVTARLSHPHIAQVHELGEIDGQLFILMEFIEGKDLLDLLARCARRGRRIPLDVIVSVTLGMLRGLDAAHTAVDAMGNSLGIVHRDVSPSNILLSYAGHAKVSDFGIAKSQLQSSATHAGTQKGKVGYMSPEQVTGTGLSPLSDIFAAGIILFEMLTMSRLFKAENDLDVLLKIRDCRLEDDFSRMTEVPLALQDIVRRALERVPERRFASASAFATAVAEFAQRGGILPDENSVAAFLREMFADKIAEERRRRTSDAEIIGSLATVDHDAPRWRYRDADGRIYGPMALAMLRELLESRAVDASESVSLDGAAWMPAAHWDDVRHIVRPSPMARSTQPAVLESAATLREQFGVVDWELMSQAGRNPNLGRRAGGEGDADSVPGAAIAADARDAGANDREEITETRLPLHNTPPPHRGLAGRLSGAQVAVRDSGGESIDDVAPIFSVGVGAVPDRARFGDPTRTGDLSTVTAVRLFHRLAAHRATGLLAMSSPDDNRAIFVDAGVPVFIESSNPAELLGQMLIHDRIASADQIRDGLIYARRNGLRLGDALVRRGVLPPQQLFHTLREQLTEKFSTSALNVHAQWQWWEGARPESAPLPLRVDVHPALIAAVMEGMRTPWLRDFFAFRRKMVLVQRVGRDELAMLPLSARALRVASAVKPGDTVFDLTRRFIDSYRWKDAEVYRMLYVLTEFEVFRFEGEPTARVAV